MPSQQLCVCERVFSLALAHLRVDRQRVEAGRNPLDLAVATLVIVGEALGVGDSMALIWWYKTDQ